MKFNYHFNEHEMLFGISTNNDDDGSRHGKNVQKRRNGGRIKFPARWHAERLM